MKGFFLNTDVTRGEIIRNIKAGDIIVNDKKIKPSYILKEKDVIKINISEKSTNIFPNAKVKFEIIYQDKNLIVVNKPAGLQVHPSEKKEQDTLVNGLLSKFPEIKNVGDDPENRPGIVHRLDKDTSGVMIVARNQEAFLKFKNKFKNREVQKTYWAIVYGKLKNKKGVIEKAIARAENYKKQTIANQKTKTKIRSAVTEYEVLKEGQNYSLVEAKPKTGRMHQIRIHLSSIGHPILGDDKYKIKSTKTGPAITRHLLHAKSIAFSLGDDKFKFEAELPIDFSDFINKLD